MQPVYLCIHYCAQMFFCLLFYAFIGIHQVRVQVNDNYQQYFTLVKICGFLFDTLQFQLNTVHVPLQCFEKETLNIIVAHFHKSSFEISLQHGVLRSLPKRVNKHVCKQNLKAVPDQ